MSLARYATQLLCNFWQRETVFKIIKKREEKLEEKKKESRENYHIPLVK